MSSIKKIYLGKEILGQVAGFLTFNDCYSLLIQCCEHEDAFNNRALIAMCADEINPYSSTDEEKNTMLICAVNEGRVKIVEALCHDNVVNLDAVNGNGNTALYRVTVLGQSVTLKSKVSSEQLLQMATALLDGGADLNKKGANDFTPLTWAAYTGNIELVTLLTTRGADGDVQDMNGWTPLMHAVSRGHSEVVHILIENHVNVDIRWKDGSSALLMAIQAGKTEIATMLIDAGADLSIATTSEGRNAVLYCTLFSRDAILNYLFQKKQEGKVDDLFLEARDKEGLCALHRAVVKDKNISVFNEIANIFTKDTNDGGTGKTPAEAISNSNLSQWDAEQASANFNSLVQENSKAGFPEESDATSLMKVLTAGLSAFGLKDSTLKPDEVSIVKKMVESGCDVNVTTSDGRTALMVAISQKQWSSVNTLLECDAIDINVADHAGKTAIHYLAAVDELSEGAEVQRIFDKMKERGLDENLMHALKTDGDEK
jgi:ankyrin repeat protein